MFKQFFSRNFSGISLEEKKNLYATKHSYHLVTQSPWPFLVSIAILPFFIGFVMYMHRYAYGEIVVSFGLLFIIILSSLWWRDVIREATFENKHTLLVQRGLRYGFVFFLLTEVMFFVTFFWGFFHASLSPSYQLGGVWVPIGLTNPSPWELPLLNTIILLTSGASLTVSHWSVISGQYKKSVLYLIITVFFALLFISIQAFEYIQLTHTISDGVFGSCFYLTTGFHGFHVIIGTIFLIVCLVRLVLSHFTQEHHVGYEVAIWYWHFVDVVWLFLFVVIYWWGS